MLLRHGVWYAIARGVPGLVTFLALTVYTRLLSSEEYGFYAVMFASVQLADALLFQWLRLGVLRFLGEYKENRTALLSTILKQYLLISGGLACLGLLLLPVMPNHELRVALVIGIPLAMAYGWFELSITITRASLNPTRFGILSIAKTGLGFTFGYFCIRAGYGALGLLVGLLLGMVLPSLFTLRTEWARASDPFDHQTNRSLMAYGLPLTASYALGFLLRSGDRFFLNWFSGPQEAGLYAVGYDLGQQSIGLLMLIINSAAFPLVMKAFTEEGELAARRQLEQSAIALLGIGLPATVGLALLADNVVALAIGEEFRSSAATLIPWIAVAALMASVKAYYFDLSFHLGKNTSRQLFVVGTTTVLNIVLNLLWIPRTGALGAAHATLVSYCFAMIVSAFLGRRVFTVPLPFRDLGGIALASILMGLCLLLIRESRGALALVYQIGAGVLVYSASLILFDVATLRKRVIRLLRLSDCSQV